MLQRVYGTAFAKRVISKTILMIEEAKKRDHRNLAPALGLFCQINYEYAPVAPVALAQGTEMLNQLLQFSGERSMLKMVTGKLAPLRLCQMRFGEHLVTGIIMVGTNIMYFTEKEDQSSSLSNQ